MANTVPTSSAQPSLTGEVVVIEPSNEMASCPDPACAPPAAAVASFDSVTKIAPTASSQDMHRLVTAVSSDGSATEVASASTDDPTEEENDAPVVHRPSASASAAGIVSAPGTSNNMIVNNSVGISAAVSSDDSTTEVTSAPTTDNPAVQEESVPPMVHRPSASNNDGTVSTPGTAHDKSVKSGADIAPSVSSEESNMVAEKTVSPDTLVVMAPVSTNVGHIVHHPASGVVHTTATEKAAPSHAMAVSLSTTEAGGIMAKHIQGVSTATAPEEANANQDAQAKKRKFEDQRKKKAKVPKDLSAPKKNLTAYMHYATRARANIASEDLQLKATKITSVVKSGWHNMSLQDRHYWNEKAAADKERYETELLAKYKKSDLGMAWQARLDGERKQVTSDSTFDTYAGTEKAEANAPKLFASAFMHYDAYARDYIKPRHPQMEDAEVTTVVQRGWNVMSAEARTYWTGVADADKVRYSRELSEYAEAIQESKK